MRVLFAALALSGIVAGGAKAEGLFVLCDNGLRCVTAPCPSTNALDLATRETIPGVHVDATRLPPDEAKSAEDAQAFYGGFFAFNGVMEKRDVEFRGTRARALYVVVTHIERRTRPGERRMCRAAKAGPSLR